MTPAEREAIDRVRAWSPTYQYQDADFVQLVAALDKAEVEIARLREVLNWYADQMCEYSVDDELCGRCHPDSCSGCLARSALSPKDGAGE